MLTFFCMCKQVNIQVREPIAEVRQIVITDIYTASCMMNDYVLCFLFYLHAVYTQQLQPSNLDGVFVWCTEC